MKIIQENFSWRIARHTAYILYISLCILSTLDTGLFVYPSLSRYLLLETGIIMSGFVIVLSSMSKGKQVFVSGLSVFIMAWIAYILLHAFLVDPYEIYRTLYLVGTLSFILVLDVGLRNGLLSKRKIENGLIVIAAIHIVFLAAQKLGLATSANEYFSVVGSNDDPTVTALYFVGVLPMLISRTKQSGLQ